MVSFSPEKTEVIRKNKNQDTGCEFKKFRLNKNEIIINGYTSVREVQLIFRKIEKKIPQFVTIAHINNESKLYDIVNVAGTIYNLEPVETVDKNEKNSLTKSYLAILNR